MTETQTLEILKTLRALPSDKAEEVKDFAIFLKERYGKRDIVDESDEWSDADISDLRAASLKRLELEEGDE